MSFADCFKEFHEIGTDEHLLLRLRHRLFSETQIPEPRHHGTEGAVPQKFPQVS